MITRLGIAIGPRTWFGPEYGNNVSLSGTVYNNRLSGAFSYAIGMTSARNFTVEGNILFGNTSFIGLRGPNCSSDDTIPNPAAFVIDESTVSQSTTQTNFTSIADGNGLTCVQPPPGKSNSVEGPVHLADIVQLKVVLSGPFSLAVQALLLLLLRHLGVTLLVQQLV